MEQPTGAPSRESELSLREVTRETLGDVLRLAVAPGQEHFVATNAVSIAQASFYPETAWFRAIYADGTPVGFVMLEVDAEKPAYHVWRFMIDQRFQKLGLGARAMDLVMDHVRTRPGGTELSLSHVPGDGSPGPFYEKLGFVYTGEEDEGELIMRRGL